MVLYTPSLLCCNCCSVSLSPAGIASRSTVLLLQLCSQNVDPVGKRFLLAVDVSTSLSSIVPGTAVSTAVAAAAISMVCWGPLSKSPEHIVCHIILQCSGYNFKTCCCVLFVCLFLFVCLIFQIFARTEVDTQVLAFSEGAVVPCSISADMTLAQATTELVKVNHTTNETSNIYFTWLEKSTFLMSAITALNNNAM